MALLAYLQIYQCDGDDCKVTFTVDTKESLEQFEADWADTTLHQYCPECRQQPAVVDEILSDRKFWNEIGISKEGIHV